MTTRANKTPAPGLLWGMYPEQKESVHVSNNGYASRLAQSLSNGLSFLDKRKENHFVLQVRVEENIVSAYNTSQFKAKLHETQIALRRDGFTNELIAHAFALVSQIYINTLSVKLFDTQIIAAYYILNGRLAEMATGEGKTYAVALAAATAALAGVPVHIITANDYLAQRDAESLQTFYQALGITVDAATQGQDPNRRAAAYACDATYCTAKEIVFDYLRDGVQRNNKVAHRIDAFESKPTQPLLLRGLCMAIIDEADSILIDEARVPLILSQPVENDQELKYLNQSLTLANCLKNGIDFKLNIDTRQAILTETGRETLEMEAHALPPAWHNRLHREEAICQALAALYLYQQDHQYLVQDKEIHIIDETTGRIAQGRQWSRGLHQLIELKEDCETSPALVTLSQITYQRFFPRYLRLGGVSGTLIESRSELLRVYGLQVSRVPLRSPNQRKVLPTRLFKHHEALRNALVSKISALQLSGQPVLIGTESVAESEKLAAMLTKAEITHVVLNARNDQDEAESIAKAGQAGAVTVTTNTAGRGTDIALNNGINAQGGLHVISCQINTARRIDRQLAGRCARQGDNGSVETWVSLETPLLQNNLPRWLKLLAEKHAKSMPSIFIKNMITLIQKIEEKHHMRLRKHLLSNDRNMAKDLSFGGLHD